MSTPQSSSPIPTTITSSAPPSSNAVVPPAQSIASLYNPPPHYHFPPFYTLQPNLTTRSAQLSYWTDYVLSYCQFHGLYRLSTSHQLFSNAKLGKRFSAHDARILFGYMISIGRAEPIDEAALSYFSAAKKASAPKNTSVSTANSNFEAGSLASGGSVTVEGPEEVYVYVTSGEDLAALMSIWADNTGQKGAVLTAYELIDGDATQDQKFHGIPMEMFKRVLRGLEKRGRVVIMGSGDGLGVKFV